MNFAELIFQKISAIIIKPMSNSCLIIMQLFGSSYGRSVLCHMCQVMREIWLAGQTHVTMCFLIFVRDAAFFSFVVFASLE